MPTPSSRRTSAPATGPGDAGDADVIKTTSTAVPNGPGDADDAGGGMMAVALSALFFPVLRNLNEPQNPKGSAD
jgi:hypothetical protein